MVFGPGSMSVSRTHTMCVLVASSPGFYHLQYNACMNSGDRWGLEGLGTRICFTCTKFVLYFGIYLIRMCIQHTCIYL